MTIERIQILNLYKQLLRYSDKLVYTNKDYYLARVKHKFRENQNLTDVTDIQFYYKVSLNFRSKIMNLMIPIILIMIITLFWSQMT